MAWKATDKQEQRLDLVHQIKAGKQSISVLCRQFKISRVTAYKWLERYQIGRLAALKDRSRRPKTPGRQTSSLWLRRLRRIRAQRPTWGPRKLRHKLIQRFGKRGVPALATMSRWLKRWGLSHGKPRRRKGPLLARQHLRQARYCHHVWTVDFKGWYRTAKGERVEPLTVRDLYSRYCLRIALLEKQTIERTRQEFVEIFKMYGLPRRIRCDNGSPFGGAGPTGLTRLSAWWVKLGIEVEFITPGCPGENGGHEQMHRVYKAEVAENPEATVGRQQTRGDGWVRDYDDERPHEALGMKTPKELFRKKNPRRMPKRLRAWDYPRGWVKKWVKGNGEISWEGKRRFVGEAFVRDYVGLKRKRAGVWRVYFGPVLVGELHEKEEGSIRMAKYRLSR